MYSISWLEPQRVILVEVEGDIDSQMLANLVDELNDYFAQGKPPLHVITDTTHIGRLPRNLAEIRRAVNKVGRFDVNIIVGKDSPILRFVASVMSQLSQYELKWVHTRSEAVTLLAKLDLSLAHLAE